MHAPIDMASRDAFSRLFRRELALNDTRIGLIIRITACTAIVVAIAMVFQIPLPAYVAYLVFMVSQEDAASTLVTAVGGLVAVTLAVAVSLLLYVFDAAEPALRIPLLALSTVAGTFLARTSKLGPIAFLAGFILVLSQTLLDDVPSTEAVTHVVLWLWVVVALPVAVSVAAALVVGESPVALARKRAGQLIERTAAYIETPYAADPSQLRTDLLSLSELKNKAFLWNKRVKVFAQEDNRLLAILLEVLQIARYLPSDVSPVARHAMAATLRKSGHVFLKRRGVAAQEPGIAPESAPVETDASHAALRAAVNALLVEASGNAPAATPDKTPSPPQPSPAIAAQNRVHARFAIKVMCAVLASYATYTLLDWPGIRTAVTTCFFVALTTYGESIHKLTLRLSGAIIGGLIGGLSIVFVLPLLTDIGQLCLLIAVVSAFCAWISTSSETIAYAGLQIAFAFFLCVLQGYGPTNDLTELRDRIVGIFVGNIWMTVFFTTLWPVSSVGQALAKRSATLQRLGDLLVASDENSLSPMRAEICKTIAETAKLNARSMFEWRFLSRAVRTGHPLSDALDVERLASAAFVIARLKQGAVELPSDQIADKHAAERLLALSQGTQPTAMDEQPEPASTTLRGQARHRLNQEIEHAARAI